MKTFEVQVRIGFKEGLLDPQAEAILSALHKLNYSQVESLKCEKLFLLSLQAKSESQAVTLGREMANKLLANLVMENFEVEIVK